MAVANKVLLFVAAMGIAFAAPRTTLDGVYTKEQAGRGQEAYNRSCARCHQADLNGTGGAPALHTSTFTDNWREGYLSNLFHHIQTWMPPQDLKGSLKEQQYLDIVAYFLAFNEFPAGAKELTKADLDTILFVDRSGPQPLPPDATIRVVGCLVHTEDWSLTRVGEFPRVHDGSETYESELAWSRQLPLGTGSYKLPDLEDDHKPADLLKLVGKKVQVKGVVHGQGANQRITVFSFEPLDPTIGPQCDK
jgi:mono/diheme cytochrome c family protein